MVISEIKTNKTNKGSFCKLIDLVALIPESLLHNGMDAGEQATSMAAGSHDTHCYCTDY